MDGSHNLNSKEVVEEATKIIRDKIGADGLIRELGKGTYGTVLYLDHHGKDLACKVIYKHNKTFSSIPKDALK